MSGKLRQKIMSIKGFVTTEPLPRVPLIEISDRNRVLIENHKGVTQYGHDKICICVRYGVILILGKDLSFTYMTNERILICGYITQVLLKGEDEP